MPDPPRTLLTLRNDVAELPRLTRELESFGARNSVPAETLGAINLALEEIVTNVIEYGFDAGVHDIDIELWLQDGNVHAAVIDDSKPFDPLQTPEPDVSAPLEEREVGGLGVLLVRRLMDRVTYARIGGRNVMTICKRV